MSFLESNKKTVVTEAEKQKALDDVCRSDFSPLQDEVEDSGGSKVVGFFVSLFFAVVILVGGYLAFNNKTTVMGWFQHKPEINSQYVPDSMIQELKELEHKAKVKTEFAKDLSHAVEMLCKDDNLNSKGFAMDLYQKNDKVMTTEIVEGVEDTEVPPRRHPCDLKHNLNTAAGLQGAFDESQA